VFLARRQALRLDRERHVDESALALVAARGGVGATVELSIDVEAAIDTLPRGARQVFVLHDVEGYKHEEIARWMGVTVGTTKAQLHRARMILRGCLNR
jgi:RNA polymerase sigma-70 factor (ECF subfamily)